MPARDPFRLKKVCADCPFRADKDFHGLRAERVADIADSLRDGGTFHCHSTLDYSRSDETEVDGEPPSPIVAKSQFCAGALATMERGGEVNQIVRIAERLGIYDQAEFDWEHQPVFEGLDSWEEALTRRAADDADHLHEG